MTMMTMIRRIERLEQQHASRQRWSGPCAPPQPSVEKLRWVIGRLVEMGCLLPRMRATSDASEQRRRQWARFLWPEQWDDWLAEAEEATRREEVEREAVS